MLSLPLTNPDMRLTLRENGNHSDWERFEHQVGATVFQSWSWLCWIAPLIDCRFVPLIVDLDGSPVGVAPMLLRRKAGVFTANLAPFPYLGPVVPTELVTPTSVLLKRWALWRRVVLGKLAVAPLARVPPGCFAGAGLTEEADATYLIHLAGKSERELMNSFSKDVSAGLRRSVKRGVSIRPSTQDDLCRLLPAVTTQALGAAAPYVGRVASRLTAYAATFPVRSSTAVVGSRAVGISVSLGGSIAVGWIGGVLREYRHSQAHTALIWDAISWAQTEGCSQLDMLGAPTPGIARYKAKFRPQVLPYPMGSWNAPGMAKVHRVWRQVTRHVH